MRVSDRRVGWLERMSGLYAVGRLDADVRAEGRKEEVSAAAPSFQTDICAYYKKMRILYH